MTCSDTAIRHSSLLQILPIHNQNSGPSCPCLTTCMIHPNEGLSYTVPRIVDTPAIKGLVSTPRRRYTNARVEGNPIESTDTLLIVIWLCIAVFSYKITGLRSKVSTFSLDVLAASLAPYIFRVEFIYADPWLLAACS